MKRIIFLTAILLGSSACGEKVHRKSRGGEFFAPGIFAQKTASEVIAAKYNKAVISCRLWSQQSVKMNFSLPPRDQKILDLVKDANLPKTLDLKASISNHEFAARLAFTELTIARLLDLKDPVAGKAYIAQFTPVTSVEIQYDGAYAYKGRVSKSSGGNLRVIYENLEGTMLRLSTLPSNVQGVIPFHDYVSCSLQTEIKPEFKDQFLERDLK